MSHRYGKKRGFRLLIFRVILVVIFFFAGGPEYSRAAAQEPAPVERVESFRQFRERLLATNQANVALLVRNRARIRGIEVIVADRGAPVFSRFGHAMVRFLTDEDSPFSDYVVSFAADVDEPQLDYRKGVFGGYRILPVTQTLERFWNDYFYREQRSLVRYVIPTSAEDRERLVDIMQQWNADPELAGDYTFASNNCVRLVAKLFQAAGLPYQGIDPRIPVNVDAWLMESFLSIYPGVKVNAANGLIEKVSATLNVEAKELLAGRFRWSHESARKMLEKLTPEEGKALLILLSSKLGDARLDFKAVLPGPVSTEDVFSAIGFEKLPPAFYELCDDESCAENAVRLSAAIWPRAELSDQFRQLDFAYWLALGRPSHGEAPGNVLLTFTEDPYIVYGSLRGNMRYVRNFQLWMGRFQRFLK